MSDHIIHPTPYPDVNAVLDQLLSGVQDILGEHFVGLYLYGSLASGDFNLETSDIDFLVVTADELPPEIIPSLEEMHARLTASPLKWAAKLEGTYIPRHAIRRYNRNNLARPCINEGRFYLAGQGSDWVIQRHIIREQGVVVAGPAPQTLIDPVSAKDIQWSVLAFLRGWWAPMLKEPKRLQSSEYQAYAVVTMCRVLYTLQIGTIASKPVAARWAQESLDQRWAGLIEEALSWRPGVTMDKFDDTLDFIRYAVESGREFD